MRFMDNGGRRAVCVWHRRAGKDKTFLNQMVKSMARRVGVYYYYFPTMTMGRKILWDGMDYGGMRFLDHFPPGFVVERNNQEMKLVSANGSIFQIIGTDRLDVVGTNPVGCVFSEYSLQNPLGWDYVRPILAENQGWAAFNFTPRGMNHGYDIYKMAEGNPEWFCQLLTVDDTGGAVSRAAIDAERRAGMSEEMIQQEFHCSWTYGQSGNYYAKEVTSAYDEGRIGLVPWEKSALVYTFWDLGVDDDTAIWFAQFVGPEVRLIEYYQAHGEGLEHFAKVLQDRSYIYAEHWVPHDAKARVQSRRVETRLDILKSLLKDPVRVVEQHRIEDGIAAVRRLFNKFRIDSQKCHVGIRAVQNYRQKYDETTKAFSGKPLHDENSHASDALRYLAVAYRFQMIVGGCRIGWDQPSPSFIFEGAGDDVWQLPSARAALVGVR